MIPGDGGAVDEFGLPMLCNLLCYDGPNGGVWIGLVEQRPIADEIEGKPDDRVVKFAYLSAPDRVRLGAMLFTAHSFGPVPGT
jgi:hypothetical protein